MHLAEREIWDLDARDVVTCRLLQGVLLMSLLLIQLLILLPPSSVHVSPLVDKENSAAMPVVLLFLTSAAY